MSEARKTPQSHFTGPVVIDPLTRIEGHLRIEVEVKDGRVSEARSVGTLYRGLETILVGRDPRDVQHFTQRTCGVCTYTHALASTRALEDAIKVEIPKNATYIRNLVLGMQYLHDHIVHFYHLHALDFVDVTSALQADPVKAAKICSSVSPRPASADGFKAVQAKLKAFVESGQLGPFTNAYFLGGHPAYYLDPEANLIATAHYKDWTKIGGTANFMTFGEFPGDERNLESRWFKPGVVFDRKLEALPFDPSKIEEHVRHSWYAGDAVHKPFQGVTEPKFTFMGDKDRYSWMKAPRYDGRAVETGPLAQVLVAYLKGNAEVVPVVDSVLQTLSLTPGDLFSTLGRTAARGIETAVIAKKTGDLLQEYKENVASGDKKIVENCEVPDKGEGAGFVTAPRGGLSHWLVIENKKVANFQLVVPSTWNLGPRCSKGIPSAVEEALVNTPIADPKRPVEILRTVHSFDPCIACAVHVIDGRTNEVSKFQIL